MAIEIDFLEGTWFDRDLIKSINTRAQRSGRVTGLAGNGSDAYNAVAEVAASGDHPDDSRLRLWRVRAAPYFDTEAWFQASYRRVKNDDLPTSDPGYVTPFSRGSIQSGEISIPWFSRSVDNAGAAAFSGGLPNGVLNRVNGVPTAYGLTVKILILTIRTPLSSSAMSAVESIVGKTNSDVITLNGQAYDANTVRFDAWAENFELDGSVALDEYDVQYIFSIRRSGWVSEVQDLDDLNSVSRVDDCERVAFADAFPIAGGSGP